MKKGRKELVSPVSIQLPDDVILEILRRLPVKTLLRFKCVSKLWKEIISSRNFTLSPTGRDRAIVGYAPYTSLSLDVSPLNFYSIEDNLSMVKLPDPAASDGYKALLMTNDPPLGGSGSAFVVSLRTGEYWTDISVPYKEIGGSRVIVYFDEEINQFREIPMPEEHETSDESPTYYFGLTLLHGCLCMSKSGSTSYSGDIFIMRESGAINSWTKLFTIDGVLLPLRTRIPNEIFVVPGSERQKVRRYYETKAGHKVSVTMFLIAGPFMFAESLASVDLI
ncbi:OLC1v1035359C1 [Oldenlandia corymbosa var. corymbosa]|uniref:OLC1v1035359C1 n=1 Tax=Oldenlandia corymbosa var. corymbosa TaxID=529605 RepID=A0AAV1CSS6_OLDCO|nr:OLC1v1035359C1 [Oldenlandia corymbosa var. corymbosa]